MRLLSRLATIALLATVAAPVSAQNVIDQQQNSSDGRFGFLSSWSGQTFTAGSSNISGAGFFLDYGSFVSGSSTATIELWSNLPSQGGVRLAAQTGLLQPDANGWFNLFWTPVGVTAGQSYFVGIYGDPNNFSVTTTFGSGASNPNGGAWYNYSNDVGSTYSDFSNYDLSFRTFTSGSASITAVPEPGTWLMMSMGLVGLAVVARRRRV